MVFRRINGAQGAENDHFIVEKRFLRDFDADFKALGALYTSDIR